MDSDILTRIHFTPRGAVKGRPTVYLVSPENCCKLTRLCQLVQTAGEGGGLWGMEGFLLKFFFFSPGVACDSAQTLSAQTPPFLFPSHPSRLLPVHEAGGRAHSHAGAPTVQRDPNWREGICCPAFCLRTGLSYFLTVSLRARSVSPLPWSAATGISATIRQDVGPSSQ